MKKHICNEHANCYIEVEVIDKDSGKIEKCLMCEQCLEDLQNITKNNLDYKKG